MFLRHLILALLVSACGSTRGMGGPRSVGARARMAIIAGDSRDRFCIDRTPVTARDYEFFVIEQRHRAPAAADSNALSVAHSWRGTDAPRGYLSHPVVLVSWSDARDFCAWRGARLPTEDEWERAAGGTRHTEWPWGNQYDPARLNDRVNGPMDTTPVLSFSRGMSELGLSDAAGNVQQWTLTPGDAPEQFVAKGSAFTAGEGSGRVRDRAVFHRDTRSVTLGFRCASECSP